MSVSDPALPMFLVGTADCVGEAVDAPSLSPQPVRQNAAMATDTKGTVMFLDTPYVSKLAPADAESHHNGLRVHYSGSRPHASFVACCMLGVVFVEN